MTSIGAPVLSTPRTVAYQCRSSSWYGPGTDRQPSSPIVARPGGGDRRVDDVPDRARVRPRVRAVVDEHGQVDTDLGRGEADAFGDVQRGEHVVDQLARESSNEVTGRVGRVQHRVADDADLAGRTSHATGA